MTITLYSTSDPINKLNKTITQIGDPLTGTARQGFDILNPRILIEYVGTFPNNANYMYVTEFDRYYYIADPVAVRNNLYEIPATIDPLMSHKDGIKQCKGIVRRSADVNAQNVMLDDGTFRTYANPKIITKEFPNGFTTSEFLLAVAGGSGSST